MISKTGPGSRARIVFSFSWRISYRFCPRCVYYVGLNTKINKSSADHQAKIISKWQPLSNLFTPLKKKSNRTILGEMLILSQKTETVPCARITRTRSRGRSPGAPLTEMWVILRNRQDVRSWPPHAARSNPGPWLECQLFQRRLRQGIFFFFCLMYPHMKISKVITLLKNQASDSDF